MEHHRPVHFRRTVASLDINAESSNPLLSKHLPFFCEDGLSDGHSKPLFEQDDFSIQIVRSRQSLQQSAALIEKMYSWRGYGSVSSEDLTLMGQQTTAQVCRGKQVFGTLTVRADSEIGLLADELYELEIDGIRNQGRTVCELSRLAIDPRHSSLKVLASLFHTVYLAGRWLHKATDFVIEVNPRHVNYYRRLLGFSQVGPQRICERVGAPAVMMRIECEYLDNQISHHSANKQSAKRSFFSYGFSKAEEHELRHRIVSMNQPIQAEELEELV